MRLLSLFLCFAFIVFLYIIDSRKKNVASHALWVPLIWMLIIYSRSISEWLNPGYSVRLESSTSMDEGNSLDRNIAILFLVFGIFILWTRKINWSGIIHNNGWLFWLYYYCSISILWSDQPFISFKRFIRDLVSVIMVLIVLTDSDPIEALKTIIRRCMYILIPLSIMLIKFFPEYGRYWSPFGGEALNIGVAVGKNGLGQICLVGGFFFLWDILKMWRYKNIYLNKHLIIINILLLIMILYIFMLANSQTSLGAFVVGVSVLINLSLLRKKIKYVGILFFHIALIAIVIFSTDFIKMIFESMGRDSTLTGRADLWEYLLHININPLVGTGYRSFWAGKRLDLIWSDYWWHPKQAHSGYLETYLNLGIIGLVSLVVIIISAYKNNKEELVTNFEMGQFRMVILFMIVIYNYTEASFIIGTPLWFLFLLTITKIPQPLVVSHS